MKIIHHRDEFGEPQTTKAIREGIFWNDLRGNWSVYPEWGHAQCSSISQAKRTFKSKFTGKYKTLENGQKFPIFQYPEKLVGGHKHNVYYNSVLKTLVTSKNTRKQLKRKYKKSSTIIYIILRGLLNVENIDKKIV